MPANTAYPQFEDVRSGNRALLLTIARHLRTVSRPVLAQHSGLSLATAYGIADELQQAGILVDGGAGASQGGRRPQLLRFEPRSWFALGVELGERDLHAVLTDLDGSIVEREVCVAQGTAAQQVLDTTAEVVSRLTPLAPRGRILGLGFASPGLVDVEAGVVHGAAGYDWRNVPLAALLRQRTGMPTYVANRSKAAALGECFSGAGQDARHLVYLYAGHGIAAGIVQNGELYAGANSSAGEIGHITVVPDGLLCECGNRGCLHTLASGMALLARLRDQLRLGNGSLLRERCDGDPSRLTTVDLAEGARAGDAVAVPLVRESGRNLGIAAATLINLFNPDRLILGGPLATAGPLFLEAVEKEARSRALAVPLAAVEIRPSALGADAGSVGAAALVLRQASELIAASASSDTAATA